MADWDHDDWNRAGRADDGRHERDWREGRDWRGGDRGPRGPEAHRFDDPRSRDPRGPGERGPGYGRGPADPGAGRRDPRQAYGRPERPASYEAEPSPFEPGGAGARGYGQGGDTSYGQMSRGSSDSGLGGYSGADVGGWGQPVQNSQWGQGGYAPLNQGLDYGQDGRSFGPQGYDSGAFGGSENRKPVRHHDEHEHSYRSWRDTQLATHDRDYSRWRDEQARRYDEDYSSWRNERHAAFSKEFEGWRGGRGGQSAPPVGQAGSPGTVSSSAAINPSEANVYGSAVGTGGEAHGANPTLAKIADGHEGRHDHKADKDKGGDHDR